MSHREYENNFEEIMKMYREHTLSLNVANKHDKINSHNKFKQGEREIWSCKNVNNPY